MRNITFEERLFCFMAYRMRNITRKQGAKPVCRVWQNSTRSSACKAVFRPLFRINFLKNLRMHLPYSADWGLSNWGEMTGYHMVQC